MRWLICILGTMQVLQSGVIIDRIAVIAGRHVIKTSDIDRDLRLTEFMNREPLNLSADARHKSAERLIDQSIIRDEIAAGGYNRASDSEAENVLGQLRRDRFGGSDMRMRQALTQYGITEDQLRDQFLWQLTVLRFIDERFRPGVLVTNEEARSYYTAHRSELTRLYPRDDSFEALEQKIRELLEGEKINQQFESWLDETRKSQRIEFRKEALG